MEESIVDMFAPILVVLLSGLSVVLTPFAGAISALLHNLPGAALSITSSVSGSILALTNGMGSCCICIPIPLTFGVFALFKRANAPISKDRALNLRRIDPRLWKSP